MLKKILSLFTYLINAISSGLRYIAFIPTGIRDFISAIQTFFHDQNTKLKNIPETNIELGKFHLYRGNIKDAILRFRISKWLFDKNNPEIDYWLGWCYFLKGDYHSALSHLKLCPKLDTDKLSNFIKNHTDAEEVPEKIWEMIQRVGISDEDYKYYFEDIYNKEVDIPREFIDFFLNTIPEFKEKSKILDFGCRTGIVGSMLDYKTDAEYNITALDEIELFTDYVPKLRGERGYIYDKTLHHSIYDVDAIMKKGSYDIIFAFDTLPFTKNLSKYMKKFHTALKDKGSLVIMLPVADNTEWSIEKKSFVYQNEFVEKQLSLAQFNILGIKKWILKAKKSYTAFICTK